MGLIWLFLFFFVFVFVHCLCLLWKDSSVNIREEDSSKFASIQPEK